mmetsp:Transcript_42433/g.83374  ORF Transcript_42433/g.83374 Transcript_42433/m.83374 type:complete len:404 (-) Transcript_42433:86-1297(-)
MYIRTKIRGRRRMSESILIAAIVLNLFVDHASSYITIAVRPRREARCVVQSTTDDHEDEEPMAVRSPLRMLGPYPVISLRFPDIATPEQLKEQQKINGESGVALDFVVDTAANVNTINGKLATDLALSEVGYEEPGISTAGTLGGGLTYMLGDCQLNDLPKEERFLFMSGLTASALPVASPSGAGLLGIGFLFSFPGGVEFCWGGNPNSAAVPGAVPTGDASAAPSLTFFGDLIGTDQLRAGLSEVPCRQLESGLVCVTMRVNGAEIPALLDTGSPISVLNAAAAAAAGIAMPTEPDESGMNPFAKAAAKAKAAVNMAASIASGEVAMIGGVDGPVYLRKIPEKVPVELGGANLGSGRPYVGEIPGLAALDGLGAGAGPAAILGTDVLRQRKRLLLQDSKVFV